MNYSRAQILDLARNNTTLVNALGDGVNSIFPNPNGSPPGKLPFIVLRIQPDTFFSEIWRRGGFRWFIYDAPGEQYYNIDKILALLMETYPTFTGDVYDDSTGAVWRQELGSVSDDMSDDDWNADMKFAEWFLYRETRF